MAFASRQRGGGRTMGFMGLSSLAFSSSDSPSIAASMAAYAAAMCGSAAAAEAGVTRLKATAAASLAAASSAAARSLASAISSRGLRAQGEGGRATEQSGLIQRAGHA